MLKIDNSEMPQNIWVVLMCDFLGFGVQMMPRHQFAFDPVYKELKISNYMPGIHQKFWGVLNYNFQGFWCPNDAQTVTLLSWLTIIEREGCLKMLRHE